MVRVKLLLIGVLLVALTLTGCAAADDEPADGEPQESEEETVPDETPSLGMVAPPGIYELPNGDTQALGILTFRDLEGGFWAVVDTAVPEEAATAAIVAVILPDDDIAADMQTYNGQYVSVVGNREDEPNIYQAGPIIEGKSIEVVSDMVVE